MIADKIVNHIFFTIELDYIVFTVFKRVYVALQKYVVIDNYSKLVIFHGLYPILLYGGTNAECLHHSGLAYSYEITAAIFVHKKLIHATVYALSGMVALAKRFTLYNVNITTL